MDDNSKEPKDAPEQSPWSQVKAYIENPSVAISEVGHRVKGALADVDQYSKDFSAQDAAMWNEKLPNANIDPMALHNAMESAQGLASVGGIGNIAKNPEALMALQKLEAQAAKGFFTSASDALVYQKATGKILPVDKPLPKLAEGGEVSDFISDDQFVPDQSMAPSSLEAPAAGADFIPEDQFISDEEKYSTPGQQLKAGLEGVAHGVAGPLATLAETKLMGVQPEDILGRQEENPITHGLGQAVGLGATMMTGVGAGAVMGKAGTLALEATGLAGKAAEAVKAGEVLSYGHRVGSSVVQQAAEMAVLASGDEVSKMILQDPNTSAESAIANVGLAAALGGAGGAFITGAVSPLWNATAGPQLERLLGGLSNHLNGKKLLLPEQAEQAINTLGIEVDGVTRAGLSRDPRALEAYKVLREGQNKEVMAGIQKLETDAAERVSQSLGVIPEEVAVRSENEAGHELLDVFKKEYDKKYAPIAEAMNKRNTEAALISIPDEARLHQYGKMIEQGMEAVGTDSPLYKYYNDWGNRLLAKETIGGVDMLKTELNGEISKAVRAGDTNAMMALKDIRAALADFQELQIASAARESEKLGIKGAGEAAEALLAERAAANKSYSEFAKMSNELTDHLGVGSFKGAKGLVGKLTDQVSAEQLLNKFSFKGNADFVPFLQKNFPEVLSKVQENELKRFLKPAVLSAKGESPINIKKLGDMLDKAMSGQKEYVESILAPEAITKIQAARQLLDAVPSHKSSGTAGWMTKMFAGMPASAMAAVGMLTGHNPIVGGLLGHSAQLLSRDVPDAIKLGYLKFLSSEQPIKAEGFKAMVDYVHSVAKGEALMAKASTNLFKAGAQVLAEHQLPAESDRTKLDKTITQLKKTPEKFMMESQGHLGHYLPNHQTSVTEATVNAGKYLASLKPEPVKISPLDKPIPPTTQQIARYNRALDIATQPTIILDHIKKGTIQASDIQDLKSMYPGVYKTMAQKMTDQIGSMSADEDHIPYTTRMGISLFLGQPMDSTMDPQSIVSAQPKAPQAAQQPGQPMKGRKGTSSLGKSNKQYMTPGQAAESDRSSRD